MIQQNYNVYPITDGYNNVSPNSLDYISPTIINTDESIIIYKNRLSDVK